MPTRALLRYHGGKAKLSAWIISNLSPHRIYIEPYGGAASVLLNKPRSYSEVYNEMDSEVCNLFQVLRHPCQSKLLREALYLTPYSRKEYIASIEHSGDPVEAARRLVVRSFMSHGSNMATTDSWVSGFRCNTTCKGSIPAHDWASYPKVLDGFIERMRGVIIEELPALKVIEKYDDADALFYVDPPYVHETRSAGGRKHGYRFEMTDEDHRELAAVLRSAVGSVVLSGYPCGLYSELYHDWPQVTRATHADGARARTEVLWFNQKAWGARPQGSMDFEGVGI